MIRFIKGVYHPGAGGYAIIETPSGIGFEVSIPANSSLYKTLEGEEVKVYTSMIVREDDMSLYGFTDRDSLELFELLITVNGIGAKAGMAIMSVMTPMQLRQAIGLGDAKAISQANGVGKKTAERVILELKDKVGEISGQDIATGDDFDVVTDERSEAVAALIALGYSKNEAVSAVGKIKTEGLTGEEYIKQSLRNLF